MDQHVHPLPKAGFFRARWLGLVPIRQLFWIDMMVVASLINLATSFAALVALGLKWPTWLSVGIYLMPLPYNLFLVVAVFRTSRLLPDQRIGSFARTSALTWLILATLV